MITIKEFKKRNDDSCLTKAQSNMVFGGSTSYNESHHTNQSSGYGYSSDTERWAYSDSGMPINASVIWIEGGKVYTRPVYQTIEHGTQSTAPSPGAPTGPML